MLSPLLAVVAIAVKLDGGPAFYRHPRVGRNFREFGLLKFRSMVVDADRRGGPLTSARDPRVTRVGRWLRRTKLDELPQLVNVVMGDMQLVGARPESERYVRHFPAQYAELLKEDPGITDPASLAYRDEELRLAANDAEAQYLEEILPHKVALSLEHARHRTFLGDLGIILHTLLGVFNADWVPDTASGASLLLESHIRRFQSPTAREPAASLPRRLGFSVAEERGTAAGSREHDTA